MVKLVPNSIVLLCEIALVSLHDVVHHLWILLLLCFGYAIVCEHALPIFGQTCELTGLIVVANVDHVDRIFRCGYLNCPRRAHNAIDKA